MIDFLFPEENTVALKEYEKYELEPLLAKSENIYLWWNTNKTRYPMLSEMARKYICIPATSTPSERVFSTAGNIVSAKIANLLPENVNKLVFLYQNKI